jgi:hypothetical protein
MANYNQEPISEGIDFNRMKIGEITANATNFYVAGSEIGLDIKLLSGNELSSGLTIQELKTDFTFSDEFIELDRLSLKTKNSHIKDYLRLEYASTASFSNFIEEVVLIARLDESKLALRDLRYFTTNIPDVEDIIYLSGDVKGPVSDIRSKEFLVKLGDKTAVFGAFELDGLPDIQNTYFNVSLQNTTILARDLQPFLPPNVQKEIQKFNQIELDADFTGILDRFVLNGIIQTSIGSIDGRINYDLVKNTPTIVSKLKIKNKNDELLNLDIGEISIEYKVDLQRIIYAASSYADIDRNVFFRGVEIPNAKKRLHANDDSILGLGEFGGVDELQEIKEDLSSLCNLVMELFEREQL